MTNGLIRTWSCCQFSHCRSVFIWMGGAECISWDIFVYVIVRMCVCICVCLWLEVHELFGIRAGWGVLKSDIFCAFLFFLHKKKLFEKFLKKKQKRKRERDSNHVLGVNVEPKLLWEGWASMVKKILDSVENVRRERWTRWKRMKADLLGHFPLLTLTGLNSF